MSGIDALTCEAVIKRLTKRYKERLKQGWIDLLHVTLSSDASKANVWRRAKKLGG
jgi:hypothetical protein